MKNKSIYIMITLIMSVLTAQVLAQTDPYPVESSTSNSLRIKVIPQPTSVDTLLTPILAIPDTTNNHGNGGIRNVFWMHGLGGGVHSWDKAALAAEDPSSNNGVLWAREISSIKLDYSNYVGSPFQASNHVRSMMHPYANQQYLNGENPERNFMIAQSQGGVVSRTLMYQDFCLNPPTTAYMDYGGLVTVSSSVQGAEILNSRDKGYFEDFAKDACNSLLSGPNKTVGQYFLFANPLTSFFLDLFDINSLVTQCDILGNSLPDKFPDLTAGITYDYKVGASFIDDLNACKPPDLQTMPKVSFYGVEPNENVMWRTLSYFDKIQSPNDYAHWDANEDDYLLTHGVEFTRNVYDAMYITYKAIYDLTVFNRRFMYVNPPLYSLVKSLAKDNMNAWHEGVRWFDRVNPQWNTIIGASNWSYTSTSEYRCCCEDSYGYFLGCTPCQQGGCGGWYCNEEEYETVKWTYTYKDNDGIVLAESAMGLPYQTHNPVILEGVEEPGKPPTGSSHFQVRNDDALGRKLNKLFEGKYDKFFKTAKR